MAIPGEARAELLTWHRPVAEQLADLRVSVLCGIGDHVAQLGLNDPDLRIPLQHRAQLVVAHCHDRHSVEAVEDENIAFAMQIADELQCKLLADIEIIRCRHVDARRAGGIDGKERDACFADLLEPWFEHDRGAKLFNDGVGLFRDQRLKLGDLLAILTAAVQRDRYPAQPLHFIDLSL